MPAYRRKLPRIEWGASRILFRYRAGDDLTALGAVFARTGEARYVDANGILQTAATGVPRDGHYINGERTLLLESGSTNLSLHSQDADNAAWTKSRATVSANADTAPDGTATADRLVEDATAASTHRIYDSATVTITDGAPVAVSRFLKAGTRSWCILGVVDSTETNAARVYFDLANGVKGNSVPIGFAAVTRSGMVPLGNGWYWCWVVGTLGAGITAARNYLGLASNNNSHSYSGDGASYIRIWGAQTENNVSAPTSYIPTTSASVARSSDSLYFPYTAPPQELTVYWDGRERGSFFLTSGRYFQVSNAANAAPRLVISQNGSGTVAFTHDPDGSSVLSNRGPGHGYDDRLELRGTLGATGTATLGSAVNGGAETVGTTSAADALQPAWSGERLYLLGAGASGYVAVRRVVVATGTQSMARMRAVGAGGGIYANLITFAYPLDEAIAYSRPQEGSQLVFTPSGAADGWDAGTAHLLQGVARWIPREDTITPVATGWDGDAGWRAFLEWAKRGNAFWFTPDVTDLEAGWDMHLEAPFDDAPTLEPDMTRAVALALRTTTPIAGY